MKTTRSGYSLLVGLCLICLACTGARPATAPSDWQKLGQRTVNHALDRDEIVVTARRGTFEKIRLRVKHRAVTFRDVKVHYANGDVQDIKLSKHIPAGGYTRVIDLYGGDRVIRKVVFWYNTTRVRGRRAEVALWGRG